ncbi:serine hydrolase domain-containing protein [Paenibacillus wynnii]|uniref:Beta-lactamase n=1 Tax=Paenibacillus wynnii TaxID=268407 RepID=A0A098M755_9BACL|nr:serine hydrolase [Paenibacillus wynnii]KGE18394.1 beta-lactamase [Paenibacillus wynnii]
MHTLNLQPLSQSLIELNVRSCLIVHKGNTVFEYYRKPQLAHQLYKINSCTKSMLSALVSIAMDQQIVPHPDTPIIEFFPQLSEDNEFRKRDITLAHLLTLTAGFQWSEFGGLNSFPTMTKSVDWVQFVLSQPLSDPPGTKMVYNSGCSQLLAAILRQASGQTVAKFAEQQLFQYLGITAYRWEMDPQGTHTGGFGLHLKPKDMAKLGLLYLQQGNWEGRQLILPATVQHSTTPHLEADKPYKGFYGWHWWVSSFSNDAKPSVEVPFHMALGFGGQYIVVVPSYDLVVVITSDNKKRNTSKDVFRQYIVPLLVNTAIA